MNRTRKCFLAVWLIVLTNIGLLMCFRVETKADDEICIIDDVLDVNIYKADEFISKNDDNIYYFNDSIKLKLMEKEDEPDEVQRERDILKTEYPDMEIKVGIEDHYAKSIYDGDGFLDFSELPESSILVENTNDEKKQIYKFEAVRLYKLYIEKDGNKDVKKVIERRSISPIYQFVFDMDKPLVEREGNNSMDVEGSSARFHITDESGISEIVFLRNGNEADRVNIAIDKRIVEYEYEIELVKENDKDDEVKLIVTDLAGNKTEYEYNYYIDDVPPEIELAGVNRGEIYKDFAGLRVDVSDNSGHNFLFYKCVYTDETGNQNVLENGTIEIAGTGKIERSYGSEGIYDVTTFSYDDSGNYSDVYRSCFAVDAKAPELSFENVVPGNIYNSDVTLYACVREMFFDGAYAEIRATLTDLQGTRDLALSPYELAARNSKNLYTFSEEGVYHITFRASDSAGHECFKECEFTIDKSAPVFNINIGNMSSDSFDMNKLQALSEKPKISVSAYDLASEYVAKVVLYRNEKENGYKEVENSDIVSIGKNTEFEMDVPYEGEYTLKAVFVDGANNTSEESISFIVDENPPVIGYINDFNEKYLKYFSLPKEFSDYITDMTNVRYKAYLNSKEVNSAKIEKDGKYILQIVAEDEAGNISEERAAFIVDSTVPKIVVSGLADNGQVAKDDSVKLTLLDDDDYFKSVQINGEVVAIDNDKEVNVKASDYGDYDISVVASDYAGNEVTEVIKMQCAMSANPFTIKIDKSDIETLTKTDDEIRESFFDKNRNIVMLIIGGLVAATGVIFGVFSFVDMRKNKG